MAIYETYRLREALLSRGTRNHSPSTWREQLRHGEKQTGRRALSSQYRLPPQGNDRDPV